MSPQEKAKQLVDRFYYSLPNNGYINEGVNSCESRWKEAVTCALIVVDEMFEFMRLDDQQSGTMSNANSKWINYFLEVKQIITKTNNNGTISN